MADRLLRALWGAALTLVMGCAVVAPEYEGQACDAERPCPPGYVCTQGCLCRLASEGGDGTAVGSLLPSPQPAEVVDKWHVAEWGNDASSGSADQPFATLSHALSLVSPGQRIVVLPGQLREQLTATVEGEAGRPIEISGQACSRPEIFGNLSFINSQHLRLRGLVLRGDAPSVDPGQSLLAIKSSRFIEVSASELKGSGTRAIYVQYGGDIAVTDNHVHHNGVRTVGPDEEGIGIFLSSARVLVANNIVNDNTGSGIVLYPDNLDSIVTHNTVVGNGKSGIMVGSTSGRNVIANNIAAFHTGARDSAFGWGIGTSGLSTSAGNVALGNVLFANRQTELPSINSGLTFDGTNARMDPGFVDPGPPGPLYAGPRTLLLRPESGALNRALRDYAPAEDYDGVPRPQGEAPDPGAFER